MSSLLTQAYGPCKVSDESTQQRKQTIDPVGPHQSTRPPPFTVSPGHHSSVLETGDTTVGKQVMENVLLPGRQVTESNADSEIPSIRTQTDCTTTANAGKDLTASIIDQNEIDLPEGIPETSIDDNEWRDGVQCECDSEGMEDYSLMDISELEKGFNSDEEETTVRGSDPTPGEKNRDSVCVSAVESSSDIQPITKQGKVDMCCYFIQPLIFFSAIFKLCHT